MSKESERRLRRQLWGVAPQEAERRLREQAEQLALELTHLKDALAEVKAEETALIAACESLEAQVAEAAAKRDRLRKGLDRHQALAPIQALVLAREITDLEREHVDRMADLQAQQEVVRAEIAERRASLHQWVMSLLESVASRGTE